MGTVDECAEEFNVKPQYIKWLTTKTAKKSMKDTNITAELPQ